MSDKPKDDMDELLDEALGGGPEEAFNETHVQFLEHMWERQAEHLDYEGDTADAAKLRKFYQQIIRTIRIGMWAGKHKDAIISSLAGMVNGADELSFFSAEEIDKIKSEAEKALNESLWSKE